HKKGINRLGNILIPNKSYGIILEKKIKPVIEKIGEEIAGYELIWRLGEKAKKESILYWANKNKIPVIVPGYYDGAVGSIIYQAERKKKLKVNLIEDEKLMEEKVLTSKKTGALMIGGGISKHHTIWWNQYKGGLDRIVYLTSAPEWDGSLSGARVREMVSWGKAKEKSKHVTVEGDATINLPLMVTALLDRLSG
ncbi:MAG: deoxyhypusine synthase family protein, partial [Candidatus Altiarchaeota archaeon]